jgi:hypothetical protein
MTTESDSKSKGFIAWERGILDHPVVGAKKPYSKYEAWSWLVFAAVWKPMRVGVINRHGAHTVVNLERGQLTFSQRFLAEAWGWSDFRVRTFLKLLETHAQIIAQKRGGQTLITICNYQRYQNPEARKAAEKIAQNIAQSTRNQRKEEQVNNLTIDICATDSQLGKEEKGDFRDSKGDSLPPSVSTSFEEFWRVKPSRGRAANPRRHALLKFAAAVKAGADPQQIIAAARQWASSEAKNIGTEYIAMAATWLHQRRYEDYQAPPRTAAAKPMFAAHPDSPQFMAHLAHARDNGPPSLVRLLLQRQEEGRPFLFETEWPPGMERTA